MHRAIYGIFAVFLFVSCGGPTSRTPAADKPGAAAPPTIPLFYASPSVVRDGQPAKLCYSVEGATTVTLAPPVESVWPAYSRCFEVSPDKNTTYKLTATNSSGAQVTATTEVVAGPPSVKIIEVSVNTLSIRPGEVFPFCVTARNAKSWKLSAGQWRTPPGPGGGCALDRPTKSTTYTITAVGAMGETDTEHVTATVK